MTTLRPLDFDTDVFGMPCARIDGNDVEAVAGELAAFLARPACFVNAKAPAEDTAFAKRLQALGFARVCTQVELVLENLGGEMPKGVTVEQGLCAMDADEVRRHAQNFVYDRISQDWRLPEQAKNEFYRRWITNSMASGGVGVVRVADGFCSFKAHGDELCIDLVSVLTKRRGDGQRLLAGLAAHAAERGARRVRVVTECENAPAFALYVKAGFAVSRFYSCLHYVKSPDAGVREE